MIDFGLVIRYLYHDGDVIQVRISANNDRFAGTADVYLGRDELSAVVQSIRTFPNSNSDRRECTLGAFGEKFAGGAVHLLFCLKDLAGHASLQIEIESDFTAQGSVERAEIIADIEPAAVDSFLDELVTLDQNLSGVARLGFVGVSSYN